MSKNNGYIFIKILIAAVTIGIIAAGIFYVFTEARKSSADEKRVSDIGQIAKALESYYDKYAYYPAKLDLLATEGLLNPVPVPPEGSIHDSYFYTPLGENRICTGYHLAAAMETVDRVNVKDYDAPPGIVCAEAAQVDFNGKADNCGAGERALVKRQWCYDIKI